MTDEWRANKGLRDYFEYRAVNHSYNFVDQVYGAHAQHIERMWRKAKRRNKHQNRTRYGLIDSCLREFMWRQNLDGRNSFETILLHMFLSFGLLCDLKTK